MSTCGSWFTPDLEAQLAQTGTHLTEQVDWATKRKDGRPKVFWNDAERETLARLTATEMTEGRQPSHLKALIVAQMALPEERRRILHTVSDMPWLKPAVAAHRRGLLAPRPPPRSPVISTAPPTAAVLPAAQAATFPTVPAPITSSNGFRHETTTTHPGGTSTPASPSPAELAFDALQAQEAQALTQSLRALRAPLVSVLAGIFRDALAQALQALPEVPGADPAKHQPFGTRTARPTLPTVLVAGLKGAQKTIIETEFGHLFNLRFYGSDESKDHLRTLATQSTFAVAVTDFLSHSQTDIMRDRSQHYVPAGGGLSSLRQALVNLAGTAH
jgi:hypothetical protein